jgi:hypothetical protein
MDGRRQSMSTNFDAFIRADEDTDQFLRPSTDMAAATRATRNTGAWVGISLCAVSILVPS